MYPLCQYKLPFLYQLTNLSLFFFKEKNVCLPTFPNLEYNTFFVLNSKKLTPPPPHMNPVHAVVVPLIQFISLSIISFSISKVSTQRSCFYELPYISGPSVSMYICRST